jgi:hypothetical protein
MALVSGPIDSAASGSPLSGRFLTESGVKESEVEME